MGKLWVRIWVNSTFTSNLSKIDSFLAHNSVVEWHWPIHIINGSYLKCYGKHYHDPMRSRGNFWGVEHELIFWLQLVINKQNRVLDVHKEMPKNVPRCPLDPQRGQFFIWIMVKDSIFAISTMIGAQNYCKMGKKWINSAQNIEFEQNWLIFCLLIP